MNQIPSHASCPARGAQARRASAGSTASQVVQYARHDWACGRSPMYSTTTVRNGSIKGYRIDCRTESGMTTVRTRRIRSLNCLISCHMVGLNCLSRGSWSAIDKEPKSPGVVHPLYAVCRSFGQSMSKYSRHQGTKDSEACLHRADAACTCRKVKHV